MEINPSYETIGSVFERNFLFEVPKYQRYYAWDDDQVEDFVKDIDNIFRNSSPENKIEHFFGGIVCVKKIVQGSNRQQKELIDGQQRITTTMLLIINILRMYEQLKSDENAQIVDARIRKIKERYIVYHDEINRRPVEVSKLELSEADKAYFHEIIDGNIGEGTRDSHNRLKKAYMRIKKYLQSIMDESIDSYEKIDKLGDLENIILNNCGIIFIDTDSRESAYKLFQVLNDRGAGLTEGDLLKSKILEVLENNFVTKQESAQRCWDEILQENPKQTEEFLRTYYASVVGNRAGRASLYDDFLKRFFSDITDNNVNIDEGIAERVLQEVYNIRDENRIYRKIINGDWPYEIAQPITEWDRKRLEVLVKYLDYEITIPILLAATKLGHKDFAKLVLNLEKFMFRYKTVCNNGHQKLSVLFMKEAKKIREAPERYSVSRLTGILRELLMNDANDVVFSVGISNLKYKSGGNKTLKYLFSTLCEFYDWYKSGASGTPKANRDCIINYENVTIEHICAQNSEEGTPVFEGEAVHKIQNLTILTSEENERVKNKTFDKKRPVYINSQYCINNEFNDIETWLVEDSELWLEKIKKMSCKVFSV